MKAPNWSRDSFLRNLTSPQSGNILRCPLALFYSAVDNRLAEAIYWPARNASFGIFNRVRDMPPMTRDQLIEFFNGQVDVLGLNVRGRITAELATRMKFQDLTTDSLDALQLAMALEEATGSDLELDQLRSCPTLLDAIDLIASTAKQPR